MNHKPLWKLFQPTVDWQTYDIKENMHRHETLMRKDATKRSLGTYTSHKTRTRGLTDHDRLFGHVQQSAGEAFGPPFILNAMCEFHHHLLEYAVRPASHTFAPLLFAPYSNYSCCLRMMLKGKASVTCDFGESNCLG